MSLKFLVDCKLSHRLLINLINSVWAIPSVLIIRLVRPIVLIRVGQFFSARIGHFAIDAGIQWAERCSMNSRVIDLYWIEEPISNKQWAKMISRNLTTFTWASHLGRWNRLIPGGDIHSRPSSTTRSRDINGILERSNTHFNFLQKEIADGTAWLKRNGWIEGQKFVCLQVRDSAYLKSEEWNSQYHWDYHSYRDSEISTYISAIKWLVEQDIFVIRMGKKVNKRIGVNHPRVIDYPFSHDKSDFLDIWLFANCDLCISTASGPDLISDVYRKPILLINYLPLIDMYSWSRTLSHPKYLVWKATGESLTLEEHLEYKFHDTEEYEHLGIQIINLSQEDILMTVKESWSRLEGTWVDTSGDEENQKKFWNILVNHRNSSEDHGYIHKEAKISSTFLRNNANFLQ